MNIEDGFFTTGQVGDRFKIMLEWESDLSLDGGYEFEVVRNAVNLDIPEAAALKEELEKFIAKDT